MLNGVRINARDGAGIKDVAVVSNHGNRGFRGCDGRRTLERSDIALRRMRMPARSSRRWTRLGPSGDRLDHSEWFKASGILAYH